MARYFIIGNFGDPSVALLQWAINESLSNVTFLSVDTGWAAYGWDERVQTVTNYAIQHGINVKQLSALQHFSDLVAERAQFPSVKFQWCASFLKGLAINQYLDDVDPDCEAILLFGKQAHASRSNQLLSVKVEDSEHYDGRTLWFPLLHMSLHQVDKLIKQSTCKALHHRSLECQPCIHSATYELQNMHEKDVEKLEALEKSLQKPMFAKPINTLCQEQCTQFTSSVHEQFDMGCGSVWGCGE